MTVQALQAPLPSFTGIDGLPLTSGYVYFGEPSHDPRQYPVDVFFDEAMAVPATQPLRTTAGYLYRNGSPTTVWIDGNCSVLVLDSAGRQVYFEADWGGLAGAAAAAAGAAAAASAAAAATSATAAQTAQTLAEAARDLSLGYSKVFTTTGQGIAATTDGQRFVIRTADLYTFTAYYNAAGVATLLGTVYLASGDRYTQDSSSGAHLAVTDSAGLTLALLKDDGLHVYVSGQDVLLTGAAAELEISSADTLFARQDSAGRIIEAIDSAGRPSWLGLGAVFDRLSTNDIITAFERESFGDTTYKYFLMDKAKSALGRRVFIHTKLVADNADASVSFARYPYYVPINNTSGVLFFGQRHSSLNNGEELQRQVCRSVTIDTAAGTITTGATVVVDQPAPWAAGTGGNAAGAVGVRLPSGAHTGRIVIVYNRLVGDGLYTDPAWEHALYSKYSDDNGATWSASTKIMGSAQIYNVNTGGSGGVPGGVPLRNGVYTGTGNCVVRIPSGPYAGRLVCSIYTEGLYIGAMYSADDGATWTRGTLFNGLIAGKQYDENAIAFCSDGSLVMLMRCETNVGGGSGRATSTDGGATWVFQEHEVTTGFVNSSVSLCNASIASSTGFEKLLAACSAAVTFGRRDYHTLRLSYDKGSTFVGKVGFFPDVQGVGYGCLQRLSNGDYVFFYETFNAGVNTEDCLGAIYFNEAELMASAQLF